MSYFPVLCVLFLFTLLPAFHACTETRKVRDCSSCSARISSNDSQVMASSREKKEDTFLLLGHHGDDFFFRSTFNISDPNNGLDLQAKVRIRSGNGTVISKYSVEGIRMDGFLAVVTLRVWFNLLPGIAMVEVFVQDSSKVWDANEHVFQVIGVALFTGSASGRNIVILSRRGAPSVKLIRMPDEALGATISAASYGGMKDGREMLKNSDLILSLGSTDWNSEGLLPWGAKSCRIAAAKESLDTLCAMSFGLSFTSFSFRVPKGRDLSNALQVNIEWPGLRSLSNVFNNAGNGGSSLPPVLSDRVSTVLVESATASESSSGSLSSKQVGMIIGGVTGAVVISISVVWFAFLRKNSEESGEMIEVKTPGVSKKQNSKARNDIGANDVSQSRQKIGPVQPSRTKGSALNTIAGSGDQRIITENNRPTKSRRVLQPDLPQQSHGDHEYWNSLSSNNESVQEKRVHAKERFSLLDFLHGPSSRGIVGRYGQPISNPFSKR